MDCCSVNGLDKMFGKSVARHDLKRYLKKGLDTRARILVDTLQRHGISGASILEIGAGIGSLHLELMKAGADHTVGFDASPAYVEVATGLAKQMGLQDRVEYHAGDFVQEAASVSDADIVVLDRVVCCYPDMPALVSASARRAGRFYALSYPRPTWWMRLGRLAMNWSMLLLRRKFRLFVHSSRDITAAVESAGLTSLDHRTSGIWHVEVFQRAGAQAASG